MNRIFFGLTIMLLIFLFSFFTPVYCAAAEEDPSPEEDNLFTTEDSLFPAEDNPFPDNPSPDVPSPLVFSIPSGQEGEPGEFITYLFQIRNQSATGQTLTVSAVSVQDWPLLTSEEEIVIPPGKQGLYAVTVWIPGNAYGGTEDFLTVNFTGPEFTSSWTITTKVRITTRFSFLCPERVTGQPGELLNIPVTLVNEGSITRSFTLEAVSEKRWRMSLETAGLTLAPGEKRTTRLQVSIPPTAAAGTVDSLYIRVTAAAAEQAGASSEEYRLAIVVRKTHQLPVERENLIPVYSNFSLTLAPPLDPAAFFTWATTLGLNGEIHPLLHYNFYLSGESEKGIFSPSALFLGLTGDQWYMQTGRFSSGWPGLIAPPSPAANLYLQTRTAKPWSLWLGAGKDFIAPAWVGGIIDEPEENLRLSLLIPLEEYRLRGVLETRYSPVSFRDWRWSYRHALGFGEKGLLNQGEFSLQKSALDWRFTASLTGGENFYFEPEPEEMEEDESAYTGGYGTRFGAAGLTMEYYLSPRLTLEPGLTFRVATVERKPRTSYTLQNRFSFSGSYLLLRFRQDLYGQTENGVELGFSNEWRQPAANDLQGSAALSWSRKNTTDTVGFSGRLRRWFYTASYLEAAYEQRWENTPAGFSAPVALGLKWYHLLYSNWEGYGSIYFHDSPTTPGYYSLQAATGYWLSPGAFLQLRATTRLAGQETDLSKIELYLFYRDLYFLPAPWGSIEGRVFLDRNRNGRFDPGEPGIRRVSVSLDGEVKAVTDDHGYFRLSRLKKGEYLLSFSPEESSRYPVPAAKPVSLQENRILSVEIPVLPPLDLTGLVFIDQNGNGRHDPDEPRAGRIKLLLYPVDGGEPLATFTTNPDGSFFLPGLFPGSYRLEAVAETLPRFTTAEPVFLTVQEDSAPFLLLFPLSEKEREIDFTYF